MSSMSRSIRQREQDYGDWSLPHFPMKTNDQCRMAFEKIQSKARSYGWTLVEDLHLQLLVHLLGRGNWGRIAQYTPEVSPKWSFSFIHISLPLADRS